MRYCFETEVKGILCFGFGTTLRDGDREYFYEALERDFPGLRGKYISIYGTAYECNSPKNGELLKIFHAECEKHHVMHNVSQIFQYLKEFPDDRFEQLSLFE